MKSDRMNRQKKKDLQFEFIKKTVGSVVHNKKRLHPRNMHTKRLSSRHTKTW